MSVLEEIGNIVQKRHDEIEIEWEIADIFFVAENNKEIMCPFFSFVEIPWRLQLKLKSDFKPGSMCLYIVRLESFDSSVEYNFGLKKHDGFVDHLSKGTLESEQHFKSHYIKQTELQQRKSELAPSDALIIVCTLKLQTSDKQNVLDRANAKKLIKLDVLSENLKDLSTNKDSCDAVLKVKDKEFKAHRIILMARSSVFAAMFQHDTLEKQTGFIDIPDCEPESFQDFLDYLYCGKLENTSYHSAFQLYITSNKYDVQKLKEYCVEYLIESLTTDNVCDIVKLADQYDDEKLMPAAQDFFNENWSKMFVTTKWESLLKDDYRLGNKLLIELSKAKGSR